MEQCLFRDGEKGHHCGKKADGGEVTIAGPTGEAVIPVCKRHKAVHNQRAAALRTKSA